jgi:hypothetical protein
MAITVSGTTITFNDGSTQSTAFTGSSVPAANAVGAVQVMLVTQQTTGSALRLGDNVSGSYVFYCSAGYQPNLGFGFVNNSGQTFNPVNRTTAFTFGGTGGATFTPTSGTWRVMSTGPNLGGWYDGCGTAYVYTSLMMRIA